jgi:putative tricarboxylic transport membrane protein
MFVNTPRTAMAAIVAVLCVLGSYAANININDIFLAFFFGVLGIVMSALGFPVSPLVLGLILGGDLLDVQFRRALMAGKGSVAPFFTRGVSIALILFIVVIVFYQYILPKIRGKKEEDRTVILE